MQLRGLTDSDRKRRNPHCGFDLMNRNSRDPPKNASRPRGKAFARRRVRVKDAPIRVTHAKTHNNCG
jgi:hypothetical protein